MIVKFACFLAMIIVCSNANTYVLHSTPTESTDSKIKTLELTTSAATLPRNALSLSFKYTYGASPVRYLPNEVDFHLCWVTEASNANDPIANSYKNRCFGFQTGWFGAPVTCTSSSSTSSIGLKLFFGYKYANEGFYYTANLGQVSLTSASFADAVVTFPSFELPKSVLAAMGFDSSTGSDLTLTCSNQQPSSTAINLSSTTPIAIPTSITSTINLAKTGSSGCPITGTASSSRSTLQALISFSSLALTLLAYSFN